MNRSLSSPTMTSSPAEALGQAQHSQLDTTPRAAPSQRMPSNASSIARTNSALALNLSTNSESTSTAKSTSEETSRGGLKTPSGSTTGRSQSFTNAVKSKLSIRRPFLGRRGASSSRAQGPTRSISGLQGDSASTSTLQADVEIDDNNETPLSSGSIAYPLGITPQLAPLATVTATSSGAPDPSIAGALSQIVLQPASLLLAQLAPAAVTSPWQEAHVYDQHSNSGGQQSVTSLSTYVSASESAETSAGGGTGTGETTPSIGPVAFTGNEQLASSALMLPAVSIAALSRAIKSLQWIMNINCTPQPALNGELSANPGSNVFWGGNSDDLSVFELGALLQTSADVMASYAAQHGIEMVLYHGLPLHTISAPVQPNSYQQGLQELWVKGNETGLSVALMTVISLVINQAKPGDTIEIGLTSRFKTAIMTSTSRRSSRASATRSDSAAQPASSDTEDEAIANAMATCDFQFEVTHSCSPYNNTICDPIDHLKRNPLAMAMCKRAHLIIKEKPRDAATRRTWLLSGDALQVNEEAVQRVTRKRRRSVSGADAIRDPSVHDLLRFCDSSLRGKKAVIYSTERSVFARHLTSCLTLWGLNTSHVASMTEEELQGDSRTDDRSFRAKPGNFSRMDSGFGGSEPASPPNAIGTATISGATSGAPSSGSAADPSLLQPPPAAPATGQPKAMPEQSQQFDPSVHFMCIDDDLYMLRKQLQLVKSHAPNLHLHNVLLNKRPALATRRTRSSAQINRAPGSATLAILHFTSLEKFRAIREVVHSILRTSSHMCPLPEVYVLPKPIGPKRLLMALHTSVRRPLLDPSVAPIATSPSSPGGHFFMNTSVRGSPAPSLSNQPEFDQAFGENVRSLSAAAATTGSSETAKPHATGASTHGGSSTYSPESNPPSPRTASTDAIEYMEYMSKSTNDFNGSASSGIVIQSPDGKASGLFFQPSKRKPSSVMSREVSATRSSAVSPPIAVAPRSIRERSPSADSNAYSTNTSHTVEASQNTTSVSASPNSRATISEVLTSPASPPLLSLMSPQQIGLGKLPTDVPMATSLAQLATDAKALSLDSFPFNTPQINAEESGNDGDHKVPEPTSTSNASQAASEETQQRSPASPIRSQRVYEDSPVTASPTSPISPKSPRLLSSPPVIPSRSASAPPLSAEESAEKTIGTAASDHRPASPPGPRPNTGMSVQQPGTASTITPSVTVAPRVRGKRRDSKPAESKQRARGSRRSTNAVLPPIKVLIVEDNPINQTILSTFMKRRSIAYDVANNGQEAVDKWKDGGYHLVLMDLQLPVKDGIEATKEIRAMERSNNIGVFQTTPTVESTTLKFKRSTSVVNTPIGSPYTLPVIIVALTASSLQTDRLNALAAGCNDFITKPVSLPWLLQKLLEWGSMSILSSFSSPTRSFSGSANGANSPSTNGFSIGMGVARERAANVANHLHLDPRPTPSSDSISQSSDASHERTERNQSISSMETSDSA